MYLIETIYFKFKMEEDIYDKAELRQRRRSRSYDR